MHVDAALSEHLQGTDGRCTAVEPYREHAMERWIAPPGGAERGGRAVGAACRAGRHGRSRGADQERIGGRSEGRGPCAGARPPRPDDLGRRRDPRLGGRGHD